MKFLAIVITGLMISSCGVLGDKKKSDREDNSEFRIASMGSEISRNYIVHHDASDNTLNVEAVFFHPEYTDSKALEKNHTILANGEPLIHSKLGKEAFDRKIPLGFKEGNAVHVYTLLKQPVPQSGKVIFDWNDGAGNEVSDVVEVLPALPAISLEKNTFEIGVDKSVKVYLDEGGSEAIDFEGAGFAVNVAQVSVSATTSFADKASLAITSESVETFQGTASVEVSYWKETIQKLETGVVSKVSVSRSQLVTIEIK